MSTSAPCCLTVSQMIFPPNIPSLFLMETLWLCSRWKVKSGWSRLIFPLSLNHASPRPTPKLMEPENCCFLFNDTERRVYHRGSRSLLFILDLVLYRCVFKYASECCVVSLRRQSSSLNLYRGGEQPEGMETQRLTRPHLFFCGAPACRMCFIEQKQ